MCMWLHLPDPVSRVLLQICLYSWSSYSTWHRLNHCTVAACLTEAFLLDRCKSMQSYTNDMTRNMSTIVIWSFFTKLETDVNKAQYVVSEQWVSVTAETDCSLTVPLSVMAVSGKTTSGRSLPVIHTETGQQAHVDCWPLRRYALYQTSLPPAVRVITMSGSQVIQFMVLRDKLGISPSERAVLRLVGMYRKSWNTVKVNFEQSWHFVRHISGLLWLLVRANCVVAW